MLCDLNPGKKGDQAKTAGDLSYKLNGGVFDSADSSVNYVKTSYGNSQMIMPLLVEEKEALSVLSTDIRPSEERVLFAFSDKDRDQFFPSHPDTFPGVGKRTRINTDVFKSYDEWVEYLKEFRPTVLISCWSTPPLPAPLLFTDSLPLRYLCHTTGTVRTKVPREFVAGGGIVTNWGNVISHNVAEHALLLILASLRNLTSWRPAMARSNECWGNAVALKTSSLRGKRVGIHGFGNVACELIRILDAFDVKCRAYSQNVSPLYMAQKGVLPCGSLDELFRHSDVIVECEALTPESNGSVTEECLQLMPKGALFVNVARGALVDEKALGRLAAEGRIRVASDVFETEPLPSDSPLFSRENVIISPHIAGPTADWFHHCGDYALDNVDRYLTGQSLNGEVTLEIYDRTT